MKNPHAVALGRKGGSKSTPAKKAALARNLARRWELYRQRKLKESIDIQTALK